MAGKNGKRHQQPPPAEEPGQGPDGDGDPIAGSGMAGPAVVEPLGPVGGNNTVEFQNLMRTVMQIGQTQERIIQYLRNEEQKRVQSSSTFTRQERRDLLDKVVDPPKRIMPSLSNIPPLMAFLIPAMDVIKHNYIPRDQWPIDEDTGRRMTLYDIWENSYYMNSLGKEGKHSIRMAGVAETRSETKGFGIQAD